MRRTGLIAATALVLSVIATGAHAADDPAPLQVYGNLQTIELAPVLYAADEFNADPVEVKMGGIPNLVGEAGAQGFASPGVADVATNAETQLLRFSVRHPDLRIVFNVTEGLYRIVARRSSGIASIADLKGKRVATIEPTSAGYFLHRMLATAGLSFDDITAVPMTPLSAMTEALRKGEVDAVAIWEPEGVNSELALGSDAIVFSGDGVYAELFNLNTTAGALADPARRAKIVRFVRAIIDATAVMKADPDEAQQLSVEAGKFSAEDVRDSWEHHRFNASTLPQMLEVLVLEEQWLAPRENRQPRTREQLATLIDTSVYADALKLEPAR
jgi:NitT/TauT family transport system substrate-binding protein